MIHVMHYTTAEDLAAAQDDWRGETPETMIDLAWPTVARATTEHSDAWLKACRDEVEADLLENVYGEETLVDQAEQDALNAWLSTRAFTGDSWLYAMPGGPIEQIFSTPDGRFRLRGEEADRAHANLALAESQLFNTRILQTIDRAEPEPPTFSWTVEAKRMQETSPLHFEHTCWLRGQAVALMVIRVLEDELI